MEDKQQTRAERIASLQTEAEETLRSKTMLQRAMHKLMRDYLTLSALGVMALMAILSYSAPLIVDWFLDIEYNRQDPYNNRLPIDSHVVDSDSTLIQWMVETGDFRRTIDGHTQAIIAMEFSPEGDVIATIGEDGTMRVRLIFSGRTKRLLEFDEEVDTVYSAIDYAPSSEAIVVGDSTGRINTWVPEKGHPTDPDIPLVDIAAHDARVTAVAYSPDSEQILSASSDGIVKMWEAATGAEIFTLEVGSPITDVEFHPDGTQFITADESGQVNLWSVNTLETIQSIDVGSSVNSSRFNSDGSLILTTSDDGTVAVWDVETGESQLTLEHPAAVNSARFTPDETGILTGSGDGIARLWDAESGDMIQIFDDYDYPMTDVMMAVDGETILTATEGRARHYLLGTDRAGRDHLSRLLYAGQISLKIGILSAFGALTIGVCVGVVAGYFGTFIDDFVMWVITTLNSIPSLYLLLIVSALLAPNENSLIFVLVLLSWTGSARIVRGETFSLRERDYVMAARALGASNIRIMFFHIVPNVLSLLLIYLTRLIGNLILTESGLSFLGFGVKPPTPTWGNMLSGDLDLLRSAPHLVFAPGILITVTVLCLFIVGDGLRDAFDPNIGD